MKQGIHPEYVECTVKCSCGNTFTTRSTKSELKVDICNVCHPFYTGQQRFVDTGGRVQRFADKFGSAKEQVLARPPRRPSAPLRPPRSRPPRRPSARLRPPLRPSVPRSSPRRLLPRLRRLPRSRPLLPLPRPSRLPQRPRLRLLPRPLPNSTTALSTKSTAQKATGRPAKAGLPAFRARCGNAAYR